MEKRVLQPQMLPAADPIADQAAGAARSEGRRSATRRLLRSTPAFRTLDAARKNQQKAAKVYALDPKSFSLWLSA